MMPPGPSPRCVFTCYEMLDSFPQASAMSRLDHQHRWRDYSASTPLAP